MKTTALRLFYLLAFLLGGSLSLSSTAMAQSEHKSYLLAQVDPDESYDPFTDYSEFEEESDEEADINFFRNGRFFTLGMSAGMRGFTGNFADSYKSAPNFGLFLTYFFDLRLALSLSFQTGDHAVQFATDTQTYTGNVSVSSIGVDLKYYMNTQNVTRGLADLNPYILGGFGQFYRTYNLANIDTLARDNTMGFNLGAGVEIPLMRKKAYLGIQATYHYVEFNDENKQFIGGIGGNERLEKPLSGDFYSMLVILGINF